MLDSASSDSLRGAPDYSTDTVSGFHAEAPQATASEGLAQGPSVADRVGFEPETLRTQGNELTTEPPCHTIAITIVVMLIALWNITPLATKQNEV